MAVNGHLSSGHVVEARDEVDDGGLAGAGRAEQCHCLAWLGHETDILEHRFAPAEVAEVDLLESHLSLEGREFDRVRLLDHLGLDVEDLEDALGRGPRLRDHRHDHPQHQHGEKGHHHVIGEGDQPAHAEMPGNGLIAAEPIDGQKRQIGDEKDEGDCRRHQPPDDDVQIEQVLVGIGITPGLVGLAGEGLDDPHAGQVLLQHRVEIGQPLLNLHEQWPSLAGEESEDAEGERYQHEHDECQLPVGGEQKRYAADHHQDGAEEVDEAHTDEHVHHLDVGRGAGEELAGLGAVVVTE